MAALSLVNQASEPPPPRPDRVKSSKVSEHCSSLIWRLHNSASFQPILQIKCQNLADGFLYLARYNLLIYLTSELRFSFPNLFTCFGTTCKYQHSNLCKRMTQKLLTNDVFEYFRQEMSVNRSDELVTKYCYTC